MLEPWNVAFVWDREIGILDVGWPVVPEGFGIKVPEP